MGNNPSNEQIKKWLKHIESAGTSANAFGWVILGLFPIVNFGLGYSGSATAVILWVVFITPLTGFYIYSGKYIKYMRGPAVSKFLLLNAFSSILLIRGIIPLILSINSFIGYSSYRKVSKTDIVVNVQEDKAAITSTEIALFVAIFIIGLILVSIKSPVNLH